MGDHGVGLWKAIRRGWGAFKARTRFSVGNWRRIKFWQCVWHGDAPLQDFLSFIISFAANKEAWVAYVKEAMSRQVVWNLLLPRQFQDWVLNEELVRRHQVYRKCSEISYFGRLVRVGISQWIHSILPWSWMEQCLFPWR